MPKRRKHFFALACLASIVCACSPATRHEVFSTLIDGCPSSTPVAQICADPSHAVGGRLAEADGSKGAPVAKKASKHKPYQEKKCDDCHDKTTDNGFVVKVKNQLCFVCHSDFITGKFVHGPVAVGECLACHDPHMSANPSLLKKRAAEVCATCHLERRQAFAMHETVESHDITCINCHDPHFGNVQYFLK